MCVKQSEIQALNTLSPLLQNTNLKSHMSAPFLVQTVAANNMVTLTQNSVLFGLGMAISGVPPISNEESQGYFKDN